MKEDLPRFKEEVSRELSGFKEEINQKCTQNEKEMQLQWTVITEAQEQMAELEE